MVKGDKLVIASLFLVPLSGALSGNVWAMQFIVLFAFLLIGAIYGISRIDTKYYSIIIKGVIALCCCQGLLVILQLLGHDPLFNSIKDPTKDLAFGLSGSPNQSALFFAVTSPVILAYAPWLIPLQLIGLFVAKTTATIIGTVVGMLFLAKRKVLAMLVIALLATIFFLKFDLPSDVAIKERFKVYKNTAISAYKGEIKLLNNGKIYSYKFNSLLGAGPNSFRTLSPYSQNIYIGQKVAHRYFHAHNDYIEVFFEYGWLGVSLLLITICNAIYRFIRTKKTKILMVVTSCIIIQAVSALFIFTVHTATSGMLLLLFYGMYLGLTRRIK